MSDESITIPRDENEDARIKDALESGLPFNYEGNKFEFEEGGTKIRREPLLQPEAGLEEMKAYGVVKKDDFDYVNSLLGPDARKIRTQNEAHARNKTVLELLIQGKEAIVNMPGNNQKEKNELLKLLEIKQRFDEQMVKDEQAEEKEEINSDLDPEAINKYGVTNQQDLELLMGLYSKYGVREAAIDIAFREWPNCC